MRKLTNWEIDPSDYDDWGDGDDMIDVRPVVAVASALVALGWAVTLIMWIVL